jgi:drug/metabolite transporter (DMT)-like permease
VVWYEAQKRLSAISAAAVQLSVPVIAALDGLALMTEQVTLRLVLASCTTLGGIAVVLTHRAARHRRSYPLSRLAMRSAA